MLLYYVRKIALGCNLLSQQQRFENICKFAHLHICIFNQHITQLSSPYSFKLLRPFISTSAHYSASATTSFTSGIMRFIMPSIPALRVTMLLGQPLQLPCIIRFTVPAL